MKDVCVSCGGPITPEIARSTQGGLLHTPDCPPVVVFQPEVICANHKRVSPGSANCADPPCQDRHYEFDGKRTVDGRDIISVTTITRELGDQFGVGAWWGQGRGVDGARKLQALGKLPKDPTTDQIVDLLKKHHLTVHDTRDDAAARGTSIHDIAEKWANERRWVDASEYPEEQRGYIRALYSFIEIEKPQPLAAEVLVGSRKGAYAGTFDLLARLPKLDVVGVIDWKSKSKVPRGKKREAYEQHHLQLAGYEAARREMGMKPADFQAVVNLYPNGEYAIVQSLASEDQWNECLGAYRALTSLRQSLKGAA